MRKYSAAVILACMAPLGFAIPASKIETGFYYPKSEFQTYVPSGNAGFAPVTLEENLAFAQQTLYQTLGLTESTLKITGYHSDEAGVLHVYAVHVVDGIEVQNHNAAIHVQNGEVLAESHSFTKDARFMQKRWSSTQQEISLEDAIAIAVKSLGAPKDSLPVVTVYTETKDGRLTKAFKFQLRSDEKLKWYEVLVDCITGELVSVINYYNNASYKVIKLPKVNPLDGFSTAEISADWHSIGSEKFQTTKGNNVDSRIGDFRVGSTESLSFDANWDSSKEPTIEDNMKAAIINNFYLSNLMHDITYAFGFTEETGNFQATNFGKSGAEGDYVQVNNHAAGFNNANFATPPDGQNGVMNMYLWKNTVPYRDGSLDNSVPIHEYGHGVSTRLTGGGNTTICLRQSGEAAGMGEGWSDAFAFMLTMNSTDTREKKFALGTYLTNSPAGIREYPYSTDMNINPLVCNVQLTVDSDISRLESVHEIGTLWASILYEVYWNLVDAKGFSSDWLNASQENGNIIAMKNIITGLKIQPCNPTFLNARDAILAADDANYGGKYKCLLWKGFAKRGLGVFASSYQNGFKVPEECASEDTKVTIPVSGSAIVTGKILLGQVTKFIYQTGRMAKKCDLFELCYRSASSQTYNCVSKPLTDTVSQDFSITFESSGAVFVRFRTFSNDRTCNIIEPKGSPGYGFFVQAK
jgi:extracellular elastinolytic metalloproteinase